MKMVNRVISVSEAFEQGDTPQSITAIADWHDARSDRAGDRHDMISFRLHRLAHALRSYRPKLALAA